MHKCTAISIEILMFVFRFLGSTDFAPGKWVGVELEDGRQGKNNGTVNGKEYFKCADNRGIFVRSSQLQVSCVCVCACICVSVCT